MKNGIAIVGLNGSGKSTLAHKLAKKINYYEIDVEDYYFPEQKTSRQNALEGNYSGKHECIGDLPYSLPRSKSEVEYAILKDIKEHAKFILSGVAMNWDEKVLSKIKIAFWLKTPTSERVRRVKEREEKHWGYKSS